MPPPERPGSPASKRWGRPPPPTSGGQTVTLLNGTQASLNPTGFFFTRLNSASTGDDTLYVADPSVGISKYSLVGTTWVSNGTFGTSADGFRSLTATVTGTNVTIYAISDAAGSAGGELISLVDGAGYNMPFTPT